MLPALSKRVARELFGIDTDLQVPVFEQVDDHVPPRDPDYVFDRDTTLALLAESRIKLAEDAPPMAAGVFGYMGYDMVRVMEDLPEPNPDTLGLPDSMMIRPTVMAIFDSVRDDGSGSPLLRPPCRIARRSAWASCRPRSREVRSKSHAKGTVTVRACRAMYSGLKNLL